MPIVFKQFAFCILISVLFNAAANSTLGDESSPTAADYPSLQAAVDANPGKTINVPSGNYLLSETLDISADNTALRGAGRLIQQNPDAAVVRIHDCQQVRLQGLTLTRSEEKYNATEAAIEVSEVEHVVLQDLHVLNNCARNGAITVQECRHADVRDCFVENYSLIAVDDRTTGNDGKLYGYAFNCIDGTGIVVNRSRDVLIRGNRVIENRLKATPEMKSKHQLGDFVKRNEQRGELVSARTWQEGYVNNWHQGSAIIVTSPEESRYIRVVDNYIENAAQGIDVHADHVTINGNTVVNAFVGMKAMHGSRYTLVTNNHFSKSVLWAIGLMPGSTSKTGNEDGDSIIANNIISEFGYGDAAWIWPPEHHTCVPIKLERGQLASNPPLRNVIVTGNVISQAYLDDDATASSDNALPPRYKWALLIDKGAGAPENVVVSNDNQFPPGTDGVTNE